MHRRARGELVGGEVRWWVCGGRAWGRRRGRSGPLEVRSVRSRGTASRACAFLLILLFLRTRCAVACASRVAQTFCYTRVCLLCVCHKKCAGPASFLHHPPYLWRCGSSKSAGCWCCAGVLAVTPVSRGSACGRRGRGRAAVPVVGVAVRADERCAAAGSLGAGGAIRPAVSGRCAAQLLYAFLFNIQNTKSSSDRACSATAPRPAPHRPTAPESPSVSPAGKQKHPRSLSIAARRMRHEHRAHWHCSTHTTCTSRLHIPPPITERTPNADAMLPRCIECRQSAQPVPLSDHVMCGR